MNKYTQTQYKSEKKQAHRNNSVFILQWLKYVTPQVLYTFYHCCFALQVYKE